MVSSEEQNLIYDVKISTVAPGFVSGQDSVQELTHMDLAMKLHYIRSVYYFPPQAFEGLTILKIKETMFNWLNYAYVPCGRLRWADSGRPYIKCNDSGVRLIEARCDLSLEEWLERKDGSSHKLLVPNQNLGPDLAFSPLVLMQLTKFKCGGTSVGLSWAHVLGDAFSSANFIVLWGQVVMGRNPAQPLNMAQSQIESHNSKIPTDDPLSIKRVDPLGDVWTVPNTSKIKTFSFHVPMSELTRLQSVVCGKKDSQQIPPFESICAVIWQCVARIKLAPEPKTVTICKTDLKSRNKGVFTNKSQAIDIVSTNAFVAECSLRELALLIMNQAVDEHSKIEEAVEADAKSPDFLVYGANLTFVDMGDVPFYEFEMRGQKPAYVNCTIDNVGDEGVVLVLPSSKGGRTVNVTLPENQALELKTVLQKEHSLA